MKRFAVISGFLGSGKTTTMMALTQYHNACRGRAAMISNDLGHGVSLADDRFARLSGCSAAQITDNCICYVNEQLAERLNCFYGDGYERIPHLKLLAWEPEGDFGKVDLIGTERDIEVTRRFESPCTDIAVLLNASAVCPVDTLETIVTGVMNSVSDKYHLELTVFRKEGLAMGD